MHLKPDEKIIRVVRRHMTPFLMSVVKIVLFGGFFIVLIAMLGKEIGNSAIIIIMLVIAGFVGFSVVYRVITYRLDRLVITNRRLIHVNWKSLFNREEHELSFEDIQHILTCEKGFLSYVKVFDYGLLQVETSASHTTIIFEDAPDPEGIKEFLLRLRVGEEIEVATRAPTNDKMKP